MRRLVLLGLLAVAVLPACAMKRVTVAQLEQILTNASAAHRSDEAIVRIFGDLELTEQLTNTARSQMDEKLHLGPKTTLALQLLADQSAFLDPPKTSHQTAAPPDPATQQHIINTARVYAAKTLASLPDLLATRTTFHFDNSEQILAVNEWPVRAGLHLVGNSTREITLRSSQESNQQAQKANTAPSPAPSALPNAAPAAYHAPPPTQRLQPEPGLQLSGEFGAPLPLILIDIDKGKVSFSHWEETSAGQLAVFRYTVPKSASHYPVDYCCIADTTGATGARSRRGGGGAPPPPNIQDDPANHFHKMPAYHGALVIDPASGAILRITIQAELDIDGPVTRADILVDYGPVLIGDRKFICPLRSLALTQGLAGTNATLGIPPDMQINEASFTNYHRLGSSIRIIPESSEVAPPAPQVQSPAPAPSTPPAPN
ncbi:MAG: hypothetical protein ABSG51_00095 [Terracidiphilus sp.]|jgi:hypothetical protein